MLVAPFTHLQHNHTLVPFIHQAAGVCSLLASPPPFLPSLRLSVNSRESDANMGKLKKYDCHKQKYYVPQNKPAWSLLNLKQASKKIEKEKSSAKKQNLGKKKKIAAKLANRKGGQGARNPANPDFKNNLQKASRCAAALPPPPPNCCFVMLIRDNLTISLLPFGGSRPANDATLTSSSPPPSLLYTGEEPEGEQALWASIQADLRRRGKTNPKIQRKPRRQRRQQQQIDRA